MPELGFHFWNSLIQSQEEKQDPRLDPILLNGRLHIINGTYLIYNKDCSNPKIFGIPVKLRQP